MHNANRKGWDQTELEWYLGERKRQGRQLLALCMTEPSAGLWTGDCLRRGEYDITEKNVESALTNNKHLETGALYLKHSSVATARELTVKEKHLGTCWLAIETGQADSKQIAICTMYFPTATSKSGRAYKESLLTALHTQITEVRALGYAVALVTDFNCPFVAKGVLAKTRVNSLYWQKLLAITGMQVLNWESSTTGFYTRTRGGQRSQLDMVLADKEAAERILVNIQEEVNLGSDHCIVELRISTTAAPKLRNVARPTYRYAWKQSLQAAYDEALLQPLLAWQTDLEILQQAWQNKGNVDWGEHEKRSAANDLVDGLADKIKTAYRGVVQHEVVNVAQTSGKPAREDEDMKALVSLRDAARSRHEKSCLQGEPAEIQELTRIAANKAAGEVCSLLQRRETQKEQNTARALNEGYENDKQAMFAEFQDRIELPKEPLPASLMTDRGETRSQQGILDEWVRRMEVKEEECGSEEDKAFRRTIEDKVREFRKETAETGAHEESGWFTEQNVKRANKKMKMKTASGDDEVTPEMIKRGSKELRIALADMANMLARMETIPDSWRLTVIIPAYKKGDRMRSVNYRPIGKTSVLYKGYERLLEERLRKAVKIPLEQCGFRKRFGTHTVLKRLQQIRKALRSQGKDMFLACLDMRQAFERAWRTGILYRLRESGVTGKLWRIIANTLENTVAIVRTNIGDSQRFRLSTGVLIGGVLSPLLYIIFFSPLVRALKGISLRIQGVEILPQLYADDGTIVGETEEQRDRLVDVAGRWMNRWNIQVQPTKSTKFSSKPEPLGAEQSSERARGSAELLLQDVRQVKILGLELTKEGVRPASFVKSLLKRTMLRIRILWAHNIESSCRWEVVVFLYKSYASSILSYSLPFLETDAWAKTSLQKAQNDFAVGVLRGGQAMTGFFAGAELGLVDMDLQMEKAKLLLYAGIMANEEDTLSHEIMRWKFPSGQTEADAINAALENLGLDYKSEDIILLGRAGLKRDLREAIQVKQQDRWAAGLKAGGEALKSMERRKPT